MKQDIKIENEAGAKPLLPAVPASEVFNEKCEIGMKHFPDKYFDLAIVDPPYGIGIAKRTGSIGQKSGQGKITKYKSKDWDSAIPEAEYFKELFRVSKNQIIWGANYFTEHLPPAKGWIVWDKRQPVGVSFAMAELAYTSIDKSTKIFSCSRALIGNKISNNARLARYSAKIHPTQKPIELYDWILHHFGNDCQKVLDTHLGSGSSRISCHKAGVDFIGFEVDADYYEAQGKRFDTYLSNIQTRMF